VGKKGCSHGILALSPSLFLCLANFLAGCGAQRAPFADRVLPRWVPISQCTEGLINALPLGF